MAEITYLPEVECVVETAEGLLHTSVVYVSDEDKNRQYLRVGKADVISEGGKAYIRVGVVRLDYPRKRALVELPVEADSGTRRLWVPFTRFRVQEVAQ